MADDNTIIEGSVKFRDGKKWKQRWCVMRRLSPVADCVQLQLYRSARGRAGGAGGVWGAGGATGSGGAGGAGGAVVASLSLAQFVAAECGFTLDKHSNTMALVCRDLVAVLAFDTRERLLQWQVKVTGVLGEARLHVVVCGGAALHGPARLHVRAGAAALTAGAPPKLLAYWELQHLRRYGVVEGRFCLEGGALCGRGEGLHVLVCERPDDVTRDFQAAARALRRAPPPPDHLAHVGGGSPSPVDYGDWEGAAAGREDTASLRDVGGAGGAGGRSLMERCVSCMSKLGALSRSSTAALTPGAKHFSPAWTMETLNDPPPRATSPPPVPLSLPPPPPLERPERPAQLDIPRCECHHNSEDTQSVGVGPYENYDVPRVPSNEVEGEYYDTPKRLRECFDGDLFKMTRSSTANALILKKPCGCLLKLGRRRKEPTVVEAEEEVGAACVCRRVTEWAHAWGRRGGAPTGGAPDKENVTPEAEALYATVDFSRKTRRKASSTCQTIEIDEVPLAHYENLNFALSLEYYENAKDLLRKAGVTQRELDAIGANLKPAAALPAGACSRCGHAARGPAAVRHDEYLMMQPSGRQRPPAPPAGYTPMSPIGSFAFHTLKHPARRPAAGLLEEKSASNPALCAGGGATGAGGTRRVRARGTRPRSSSADSSRFLDEVKEFDDSGGGSGSSLETLRDAGAAGGGAGGGGVGGAAPAAGGARDSSSSNDSGVSCRELPRCSAAGRRWYRASRRPPPPARASRPRSSDPPAGRASPPPDPLKSSSAEAEVPLLMLRPLRGGLCVDSRSTSSGASDMSDYIETLSLCSSHSSTDTPITMKSGVTSTLRPRSGREYARVVSAAPPAPPRPAPPAPPPPPPAARPPPPAHTDTHAQ